jgi:hypothetical protein
MSRPTTVPGRQHHGHGHGVNPDADSHGLAAAEALIALALVTTSHGPRYRPSEDGHG